MLEDTFFLLVVPFVTRWRNFEDGPNDHFIPPCRSTASLLCRVIRLFLLLYPETNGCRYFSPALDMADKGAAATALTFSPVLSRIDTQRVVAVVEKAIERLQLLSMLNFEVPADMGNPQTDPNASRGVGSILEEQKRLEARYEALVLATQKLHSNPMEPQLDAQCFAHVENRKEKEQLEELRQISVALKEQSKLLCRQLKDNPNDADNWRKIIGERSELITVLSSCVRELMSSATTVDSMGDGGAAAHAAGASLSNYEVFAKKVLDEQSASQWADELVKKEKETNQNVKQLQNEVRHERVMKEEELEARHKSIAELKAELRILKQSVKESMDKLRAETEAGSEAQQRAALDQQRILRNKLMGIRDKIQMEMQVNETEKRHVSKRIAELEALAAEQVKQDQSKLEMENKKHMMTTKRNDVSDKLQDAIQKRYAAQTNKQSREEEQKRRGGEKADRERLRDARYDAATKLQAAIKGFFTRQQLIPLKKKFGKKKK